jgi:spore maturation protein CgeB
MRRSAVETAAESERHRDVSKLLQDEQRALALAEEQAKKARGQVEHLTEQLNDLRTVERALKAERDEMARQAQDAQWRLRVQSARRWTRMGDELVRAKRAPKKSPEALKNLVRIARGPSVVPARPSASASAGVGCAPEFPAAELPDGPIRRPELKVAAILDEFSQLAFRYEVDLKLLSRARWHQEIEDFGPDMLLVESAWNANGGEWQYAFTGEVVPKPDVLELLQLCRQRGIPTVFWNKEDPLEFDLFLRTAKHFEHIFTVDQAMVERYRAEVPEANVGVMPFGIQPRIHNPVDGFRPRSEDVAFAGAYYSGKYPERQEQMKTLLGAAASQNLHIWSRFHNDPKYAFPGVLNEHVVGSLSYAQMLTAYRGYKLFLNVNSVVDSPTMFSRRVLELLACGTPVLSTPARGMEQLLGDAVVTTSEPVDARDKVRALVASKELRDQLAVRGLRKVMTEHTYGHRVDGLVEAVGLDTGASRPPSATVSIVCSTNRAGGAKAVMESVASQVYADKELVLVLHGVDVDHGELRAQARKLGIDELSTLSVGSERTLGDCLNEGVKASSGRFIAKFDDDDLYGPNYLADQMAAFSYTEAGVVGKWTRYVHLEGKGVFVLVYPGHEHQYTTMVGGQTLLFDRDVASEVPFESRSVGEDTAFLKSCLAAGVRIYSTDRFNLVYRRSATSDDHTWRSSDWHHLAQGVLQTFKDPRDHVFI